MRQTSRRRECQDTEFPIVLGVILLGVDGYGRWRLQGVQVCTQGTSFRPSHASTLSPRTDCYCGHEFIRRESLVSERFPRRAIHPTMRIKTGTMTTRNPTKKTPKRTNWRVTSGILFAILHFVVLVSFWWGALNTVFDSFLSNLNWSLLIQLYVLYLALPHTCVLAPYFADSANYCLSRLLFLFATSNIPYWIDTRFELVIVLLSESTSSFPSLYTLNIASFFCFQRELLVPLHVQYYWFRTKFVRTLCSYWNDWSMEVEKML